jgi:hypothetical protein
MRTLVLVAILVTVAGAGFYSPIPSAVAAAWNARPATFSERFAPALQIQSASRTDASRLLR